MKKTSVLFSCLALFFMFACKPDDPIVPDDPQPTPHDSVPEVAEDVMLVLNEGTFTYANSSLTYYNIEKDSVENYVFFNANGAPIGDVGQSLTLIEDQLFIVVNNSNYIYKVDANTFKCDLETPYQITDFYSPRYMLPVAPNKAYVSDIIGTDLWVINPQTMTHIGTIPMGKSTENMVMVGNEVYVSNWSKAYVEGMENNTVQVVDVNTDAKIAEITVGKEPNTMVVDKNNMVWVLCEGATWDYIDPGQPELWKIDPATKQATRMVLFTENAMNLAIDPSGSYLYYVRGGDYITGGDVHRVSIDNPTVEDDFVILANDRMIYKLFVNPNNGDIYLSDAKDYTVDGTVYRYSSTGTLLKSFDAGICPGFMLFY